MRGFDVQPSARLPQLLEGESCFRYSTFQNGHLANQQLQRILASPSSRRSSAAKWLSSASVAQLLRHPYTFELYPGLGLLSCVNL
jgi:hypothetical protein